MTSILIVVLFGVVIERYVYANYLNVQLMHCIDGSVLESSYLAILVDRSTSKFVGSKDCLASRMTELGAGRNVSDYLAGWASLVIHQTGKSIMYFDRVGNSRYPLTRVLQGIAYLEQGDPVKVADVWEGDLIADQVLAVSRWLLTVGRPDMAVHMLEALEVAQPTANVLLTLAQSYERMQEWDLAAYTYKRVLEIDPTNPEALLGMASIAISSEKDVTRARSYLYTLLENEGSLSDKVHVDLYRSLSRVAYLEGNYEEAANWQRRLLDYPHFVFGDIVRLRIAELYFDSGDMESANEWLVPLVANPPTYRPARQLLAYILRRFGRIEESIEHYQFLVDTQPDDRTALIGLAHTLEIAGRCDEALMQWRRLLELDPGNQEAINAIHRLQSGNRCPPY